MGFGFLIIVKGSGHGRLMGFWFLIFLQDFGNGRLTRFWFSIVYRVCGVRGLWDLGF